MTTRQERVAALIQQEVSEILRRKVSDPRIGFVSVTAVEIAPDFKNASIFISIYGDEKEKNNALAGLASATGYIQSELGQRLELRSTPEIRFVQDESLERGSRVLQLINSLNNEKRVHKNKRSAKKR